MADIVHSPSPRPTSSDPDSLLFRTNSFRSTIVGIGSDSGRLVLALGISVLRAVDAVDTALAFRRLHRDVEIWWQGLGPLPKTSLATILELVRSPSRARMDIRRIRALLILSMQHEDIVRDVLTNIRHTWQRNEVLRFVQSLGLIKLSLSRPGIGIDGLISVKDLRTIAGRNWKSTIIYALQLVCAIIRLDEPLILIEAFTSSDLDMVTSINLEPFTPTQVNLIPRGNISDEELLLPGWQMVVGA